MPRGSSALPPLHCWPTQSDNACAGQVSPRGPGSGDSDKSHDVYTQKDTWDCSATGSASDCHVCFGDEIILEVFSCLVAKDGEAGSALNGAEKKELHIVPAIVEPHNKKGKVIQIAAQLRSPRICFSIFHLPTCTKGHLCTCALHLFILVSWAEPIQLFKGMQMVTAAHNAGIQRHFVMTGSLGPLSVCCRDYCNISGLQYPHLSPPGGLTARS